MLATGILTALLLTATAAPLQARDPDLRTAELMQKVESGFTHIYNLDYGKAQESFEALAKEHPRHPAPPLYTATSVWLRELFQRQDLDLDLFISPSYFDKPTTRVMPAAERERFFALVERSQELSEAILEQDPQNQDARYFLGSAQGILASFAITIDRSKKTAFDHGKKAYRFHKELVEENPDYYDAYMSVGLYEYVVGNLPWYIKWLAAMVGYRGSVQRGFEYLDLAVEKGRFVSDDARVLQMVLFVREKRYGEALENVRHIRRKGPRNFIAMLNEAHVLEKLGRTAEALTTYRQLLRRAEAGEPNFHLLPLGKMRYTLGRKFWELEKLDLALATLEDSIGSTDTPPRERALSRLLAGQILDTEGRRDEALAHYRAVLELGDVEQSHKQARKYLEQPYSGS